MFDKFKYNGKFQVLVDGTGLVTFNHKHCEHCLVNSHKDRTFTYEHNALKAKIIFDKFFLSNVFIFLHFLFFEKKFFYLMF